MSTPEQPVPTDELNTTADDASEQLSESELLRSELAQCNERYLRLLADHENARRNHHKELQDQRLYSAEHMITRMLPVLDDLHNAVEHSKTATDADALRTGLELIFAKAVKIFEDAGLRPISVEAGQPFNVEVHEALMHTPSEHPEGHVVQEVQRGYQLHDKVIRHSKVITSAGLPPADV